MNYFKPEEFHCSDGCSEQGVEPELENKLNIARHFAGIPFIITSGYRCKEHNDAISGKPKSPHLKGLAVDISAVTSRARYLIISALLKAGFTRIGIGEGFIHADIGIEPDKVSELIWTYY